MAAASGPRAKPLSRLDRGRYLAWHRALGLFLGGYMESWHWVVLPGRRPGRRAFEALHHSFEALLEADLGNVEAGHYPRELLFSMPLGAYLRVLPMAIMDQPRVYWRARARRLGDLPASVSLDAYPPYYRRTFHWQTDGWLSRRSARLYDFSVELLFGGVADVMRRMTMPPLLEGVRGVPRPRILDIGCGTGRFLVHLERALRPGRFVGVDMSPFYVAHARQAAPLRADMRFMAENAESLSFAGGSFDAAVSIFLFHELPGEVRRRVACEAYRVLRPGTRFVVCDAAQRRDYGPLRLYHERFPEIYHEPYFEEYLDDDLETLLESCGFEVERSQTHFVSKVVVARRPESGRRRLRSVP